MRPSRVLGVSAALPPIHNGRRNPPGRECVAQTDQVFHRKEVGEAMCL